MTDNLSVARTAVSPRSMLVPLALAQFICSKLSDRWGRKRCLLPRVAVVPVAVHQP